MSVGQGPRPRRDQCGSLRVDWSDPPRGPRGRFPLTPPGARFDRTSAKRDIPGDRGPDRVREACPSAVPLDAGMFSSYCHNLPSISVLSRFHIPATGGFMRSDSVLRPRRRHVTVLVGDCSSRGRPARRGCAPSGDRRRGRPHRPRARRSQDLSPAAGAPSCRRTSTGSISPRLATSSPSSSSRGRPTPTRRPVSLTTDGKWTVAPGTAPASPPAPYTTRVVVYRPIDPKKFNGTVVVEWLNVSGGLDADPDWTQTHNELIRDGFAWVGVSAQAQGVNQLKCSATAPPSAQCPAPGDPARYASLVCIPVTATPTTSSPKPVRRFATIRRKSSAV